MSSEMVEEEVNQLRNLSDDEIAQHYANNVTSNFPMMVRSEALALIMKERKFTVKLSIQYEIVKL